MNELLTKEQRFNEILIPKDSTYCISLIGIAVKLGLISDKNGTTIIERLTRFFEDIAHNTSENREISVSLKIIVSNYFFVLTYYLSHRKNFEAFELMKNTNTSELVKKAEKYFNNKIKIIMNKVLSYKPIPKGMFEGFQGIIKAYNNILKQYRIYDLNDVYVHIDEYSLATSDSRIFKNPVLDFYKYVEEFLLECTILNNKFSSSIIEEVCNNLESAAKSAKKRKLQKIEDNIAKLLNAKDAKLKKLDEKLQFYYRKQEELDSFLNSLSDEELDSGEYDEEISKYDFDIAVVESKVHRAKREIEDKSEEILQKLENKKEKMEIEFDTEHGTGNILHEVLNEWLLYNWVTTNKLNYSNLTNVQKEELIRKLNKDWIMEQIKELNLDKKSLQYVEEILS